MSVVLDTSVLSALMRREQRSFRRMQLLRPGDVVLCSPVAAEIGFGLERLRAGSRRRELLESEYERWRSLLYWRDWDRDAATEFGRQKALLEHAGTPVSDMDVIIASVALSIGGAVATANVRDFRRMKGLRVEDWGSD